MQIRELNGAPAGTPTDKTSGTIRYKMADNATVDLNNTPVVPTSGRTYTYEKWHRLYISAGTYTQIDNLRAYTDGGNGYGTGILLWAGVIGAYATPVVPSVAASPPTHAGMTFANAFSYTTGSPLNMDGINVGPYDSTGIPKYIGDFIVSVMEIGTTASQGVKSAEPISWSFDET